MFPSAPVFSPPCRTPIIRAVAVPLGKRSFSLTITSFLNGTAKNTPKKHNPSAQRTSLSSGSLRPPVSCAVARADMIAGSVLADSGVSSGLSRNSSAGITPTKPQPSGIVPTLPATVCTSTFSTSLKSSPHPRCLRTPPSRHTSARRPLK